MRHQYQGVIAKGEDVSLQFQQNGAKLAEESWEAKMPGILIIPHESGKVFQAEVSGEELLIILLGLSRFTQADLLQLSRSRIPEIRLAAVFHLGDQAQLSKVRRGDPVPAVRKAAAVRLNDLAEGARIAAAKQTPEGRALYDLDPNARKTAIEKITAQDVLAKVAIGDAVPENRQFALTKITDEAMLVSVAKKCEDFLLSTAAIEMLTSQASLIDLAITGGDQNGWRASMNTMETLSEFRWEPFGDLVGKAAVKRLTDRAALAKVAATAKSSAVRDAASAKLAGR